MEKTKTLSQPKKERKSLGLYIHIPFCRSKCLYCDFCSFPNQDASTVEAYVQAVCQDLERQSANCNAHSVDTIYFGGGTPMLLPARLLLRILEQIVCRYHVAEDAEITAECNPATGNAESFAALRHGGFNRLSIGLQSIHANELRALGRLHGFADFQKTFGEARAAGFENISGDLMMGIPEQSLESYLQSLAALCALRPEHVSAYTLSVEEGTPFFRLQERARLPLPEEETVRSMYFEGIALLESLGYKQYEISNFARAGYASRHNLKYWNCEEYLGFGPAAYSDFGGARFGNSRLLDAYIEGRDIRTEWEVPSHDCRMNEYVMLRMRLCRGVSRKDFFERFGVSFQERFGTRLEAYLKGGFVCRTEEGYAFTPQGFSVSNTVLSELLDFSK